MFRAILYTKVYFAQTRLSLLSQPYAVTSLTRDFNTNGLNYERTGYLQSCSVNYSKSYPYSQSRNQSITVHHFLHMCRMQLKHCGLSCKLGFGDDAGLEALCIFLRFMNVYML